MTTPASEKIIFYGTQGRLEVSETTLRGFDCDNKITADEKFDIDQKKLLAKQIRHFGQCLSDPNTKAVTAARKHLANVAIIESAYLSAQTQLPESLQVYGSVFQIG